MNVMKEAGPGLFEFEGPTHDLFLGVLVRRKQVHGLDVAEVDVVAEQEDEEQLANVLLLLVAVQRLVALEFAPGKFCFFVVVSSLDHFPRSLTNLLIFDEIQPKCNWSYK